MRKWKLIVLCIVFVLLLGASWYYVSLPDYYIRNSIANSSGKGSTRRRDVELDVIAPKFYIDSDELLDKIRSEHNEINGEPTTLEITLYRSLWHKKHGKPFINKTFEKGE